MSRLPAPQYFELDDRRIAFRVLGEGERTVVLIHGLLMDSRMYAKLGPILTAAGNRVILVDMLGHGASQQSHDMTAYSMPQFGQDIIALLDHLNLRQAVIGGTSLGANVALEIAVVAPQRVRALVLEMPVLEHGIAAAATTFVPLALAIRVNKAGMKFLSAMARRIPRSYYWLDLCLDFVRRDPLASLSVLDGLTFGRIAPSSRLRKRIKHLALVVGHRTDPIHPFSDAATLAAELENARLLEARSIFEWRMFPKRLDATLVRFLKEVWAAPRAHLVSV